MSICSLLFLFYLVLLSRYQWYVGTELAGYVKQAGKLTEVLVRAAGHMVPSDQPKWAWDLITRFTRNKPLHNTYY